VHPGDPVVFPHVFEVQLNQIFGRGVGGGGDEMGHFGESVHDDINCVISL